MTQAFNLSQLANNINSAGELNASAIDGAVAEAQALATANFTVEQVGTLDSTGTFTTLDNVTAYGTP